MTCLRKWLLLIYNNAEPKKNKWEKKTQIEFCSFNRTVTENKNLKRFFFSI